MFKVNNKNTRRTPLASIGVNFEHVIAGWFENLLSDFDVI